MHKFNYKKELTRTCDVHRSLSREQLLRGGQCPHSLLVELPSSCSGTSYQDIQQPEGLGKLIKIILGLKPAIFWHVA
jgi:hypothetical protein